MNIVMSVLFILLGAAQLVQMIDDYFADRPWWVLAIHFLLAVCCTSIARVWRTADANEEAS